jgi:hypothetical protein
VRRSAGESLQPQPAPREKRVRRSGSVTAIARAYGEPFRAARAGSF